MLKKLAKYGNSTTLVIDKAILELLNMDESSIVKLHTDGKSLIITPVVAAEKDKISSSTEEVTRSAMETARSIMAQKVQDMPTQMKAKVANPDPEMARELKAHFERHEQNMKDLAKAAATSEEYAEALKALEQKYDPKTQPTEYMEEYVQLRGKCFPEFAQMDKELLTILEKYK